MMVIIAPSSVDQQYNNYINDVNKCSLRSNFLNFIHQGYIQVQGNPIESTQAYIKIGKHLQKQLQMIPEMSENDFKTLGLGPPPGICRVEETGVREHDLQTLVLGFH
jgi:hypothetical protein